MSRLDPAAMLDRRAILPIGYYYQDRGVGCLVIFVFIVGKAPNMPPESDGVTRLLSFQT